MVLFKLGAYYPIAWYKGFTYYLGLRLYADKHPCYFGWDWDDVTTSGFGSAEFVHGLLTHPVHKIRCSFFSWTLPKYTGKDIPF